MSETAEYQRPEGRLIQEVADSKGVSMRALAEAIGMSEARVRNIVNGYQAVGQGQRISIHGPEDTVAKMAGALKISPEQLEAAGRPDAAHALRRRLPGGPMPEWAGEDEDEIWRNVVAEHEEIREWAEDPANIMPPDAILNHFSTDSLLGEVASRVARAGQALGPWFWLSAPTIPLHPAAEIPSESDESMPIAALDVDPGVDQEAGESTEG